MVRLQKTKGYPYVKKSHGVAFLLSRYGKQHGRVVFKLEFIYANIPLSIASLSLSGGEKLVGALPIAEYLYSPMP